MREQWMESDLVALNQTFAVMEQRRDRAARHFFTRLLSSHLLLRRANGQMMGKRDFLQSLTLPSPFTQYTLEQLEFAQVPEARQRVMVTLLMRTEDRYSAVRSFRHIRLFTLHPTGWQLEFWYVYEDVCA